MANHISGPWGLRIVHIDHKLGAVLIETKAPNQPCNDPVLFALREDWLSIVDLPDTNPRKASLNLLLRAPDMAAMLQRLAAEARRVNAIQHSGRPVADEDWAELRQATNEAFEMLEHAEKTPSSAPAGVLPPTSATHFTKGSAWLAFATDDGEVMEQSLHATEAEAAAAIVKAFERKADNASVPSLSQALKAPHRFAKSVDLETYVGQDPAWQGHRDWLTTEQGLPIDAWIMQLDLPGTPHV